MSSSFAFFYTHAHTCKTIRSSSVQYLPCRRCLPRRAWDQCRQTATLCLSTCRACLRGEERRNRKKKQDIQIRRKRTAFSAKVTQVVRANAKMLNHIGSNQCTHLRRPRIVWRRGSGIVVMIYIYYRFHQKVYLRSVDFPYRPVLSYITPSWTSRPCVNASLQDTSTPQRNDAAGVQVRKGNG